MKTDSTITYKDPLWLMARLDTALEKEKEKYRKCPVNPDLAPGHEATQRWGYVVAGYFLVEQSFKALLHIRGEKDVPKTHSLTKIGSDHPNYLFQFSLHAAFACYFSLNPVFYPQKRGFKIPIPV